MQGDRWSAGTGSVYTALPLYMSEELTDKTQRAGPAPTFPSTALAAALASSHCAPAAASCLCSAPPPAGTHLLAGTGGLHWSLPASRSVRPRELERDRETAVVTTPVGCKIPLLGGPERLLCASVRLPGRSEERAERRLSSYSECWDRTSG